MSDTDLTQTCCERDCGATFVVSVGEQDYFLRNGLQLPRRCRECREKRKAAKGPVGVAPQVQAPVSPPPSFETRGGDRGGYAPPAKKRRHWESEDDDYSSNRRR